MFGRQWMVGLALGALFGAVGLAGCGGGMTPDAGMDAGIDAGPPGTSLGPPKLRYPYNGVMTGSVHVALTSPVVDHPLKPKFMWAPVAGATSYELELDDSCEVATFRSCTFPTPEHTGPVTGAAAPSGDALQVRLAAPLPVSMTAPVGTRYYWRMRSCDAGGCSAWSETRYLDVGRMKNDYNGDGYGDLAVGAHAWDWAVGNHGSVFLFYGQSGGMSTVPDGHLYDVTPRPNNTQSMGFTVAAAGDLNADGFADLLVGAHRYWNGSATINNGAVMIYLGRAEKLSAVSPATVQPSLVVSRPRAVDSAFGVSVAGAGDVNGDGYGDWVAGAHLEINGGAAYVFYGHADTLAVFPSVTLDGAFDAAGEMGRSVSGAGDVDGDGFSDVIVGAFQDTFLEEGDAVANDEGVVRLYRGGLFGLSSSPHQILDNPRDYNGWMGHSVTGEGDVNGDGYSDIATGARFQTDDVANTPGEGMAYVFHGGAAGVTLAVELDHPEGLPDVTNAQKSNAQFGVELSLIGDADGDGFADLAVGAFAQDRVGADQGKAFVYRGGAAGIESAPYQTLVSEANLTNDDENFGRGVSTGFDANGDGYSDLNISAHLENVYAGDDGQSYVYFGSAAGIPAAATFKLNNDGGTAVRQAGGYFGFGVQR